MRILLFLICSSIIFPSHITKANQHTTNSENDVTIVLHTTKEDLSKDNQTLIFEFHANFSEEEFKKWEKNLSNDKYVKKVVSNTKDTFKLITISLNTPLTRSVAKELFSFSIKATYVVFEEEKMLFNVFVSKHIPQ